MQRASPQSVSPLVPAAQYLRMSTDRQEYSVESQSQAIAKYAKEHGFSVIQTYWDPATSGIPPVRSVRRMYQELTIG